MGKGGDSNMKIVMGWSIGLAGIALLGLVMLILFGNLSGNVGFTNDGQAITVTNESGGFLNFTGYQLGTTANTSRISFAITEAWNTSNDAVLILSGNYSVTSGGNVTNITALSYPLVNYTYTYTFSFPSEGLTNTNQFIGNYTTSILNLGAQFPTVGTIIGVALLLFILIALLIFALVKLAGIGSSSGGRFG